MRLSTQLRPACNRASDRAMTQGGSHETMTFIESLRERTPSGGTRLSRRTRVALVCFSLVTLCLAVAVDVANPAVGLL